MAMETRCQAAKGCALTGLSKTSVKSWGGGRERALGASESELSIPSAAPRAERRNCSSGLKRANEDCVMGSPNVASLRGQQLPSWEVQAVLFCADRASLRLGLGAGSTSRQRSRGRKRYLCGHVVMHTLTGMPAACSVPSALGTAQRPSLLLNGSVHHVPEHLHLLIVCGCVNVDRQCWAED